MDLHLLRVADGKLGLFTLFAGNIFSIADVGYVSKPNPDVFLYAARRMNSAPASCLVIEGSPWESKPQEE